MKILIIGFGSVGKYVLDYLTTKQYSNLQITVGTRNIDDAERHINLASIAAGLREVYPQINLVHMDLNEESVTAEHLKIINPDIIVNSTRFFAGQKYGSLSYPNGIGYGVWTPMSVVLIYKLMKAVKESGIATRVINTSYPDATNPWLKSAGYEVWTGVGNLSHLVPRVKMAVAKLMPVDIKRIEVYMAGSHYLNTIVSKEGASGGSPYWMKILTPMGEVEVDDEAIFSLCKIKLPSGVIRNKMIASDVVQVLDLMLEPHKAIMHLPGLFGNIGGYPTYFHSYDNNFIIYERDKSVEEFRDINERSLRCDGIQKIDSKWLWFTDRIREQMKKTFKIEYPPRLHIEDAERFALEIKGYIKKYLKGEKK